MTAVALTENQNQQSVRPADFFAHNEFLCLSQYQDFHNIKCYATSFISLFENWSGEAP